MRCQSLVALCICCCGLLIGCKRKAIPQQAANQQSATIEHAVTDAAPAESVVVRTSSIQLPAKDHWRQPTPPPTKFDVVYFGDPGDVYYTRLHRSQLQLDLTNIDTVRQHFREATRAENGGIISVEVTKVQGLNAIVYYSKQVVEQIRGYRYVARCVIPLQECWFEIRMDAIDMGVVQGGRETVASMRLGKDREYEDIPADAAPAPGPVGKGNGKRIKGYFHDPYDAKYDSSAMMSIADDPALDEAFPEHPVSRVRARFPKLLEDLEPALAELQK